MIQFYNASKKAIYLCAISILTCSYIANAQTTPTYCTPTWSGWAVNEPTRPITLIQFGIEEGVETAIDNTSTSFVSTDTPRYEDFTSNSVTVNKGNSYTLKIKGNTDGNNTDYITVYFDWNGDGTFSNATPNDEEAQQQLTNQPEKHQHLTALINSTGEDNLEITHTVTVPTDASTGEIRMRIVKNYNAPSNHPCDNPFIFGQVEDYTLKITDQSTEDSNCEAVDTFLETFEDFTAFPEKCWSSDKAAPYADIDTHNNSQVFRFYSFFSASDPIYLVSPEVTTIDGNHLLSFDIAGVEANATTTTLQVGTLSDNTDFSTFSPIETAFNPIDGTTHTTIAIPANPGHKYIAIKYTPDNMHQAVFVDNIEWKATTAGTDKFDSNKVKIYPNPTSGIFYIDTEIEVQTIEVYNISGQRIALTPQKEINLQNAANGVYIVNVIATDGTHATYKVIKK